MREIKFRGRSATKCAALDIKFGDWVYGSFIQTNVDAPCIISGNGEQFEIDLETLGQFTGLTDRNGVEICEGDVLIVNGHLKKVVSLEVRTSKRRGHGESYFETGLHIVSGYGNGENSLEVIGNIHENPELLEPES